MNEWSASLIAHNGWLPLSLQLGMLGAPGQHTTTTPTTTTTTITNTAPHRTAPHRIERVHSTASVYLPDRA